MQAGIHRYPLGNWESGVVSSGGHLNSLGGGGGVLLQVTTINILDIHY